jgi:hypothetical protein
MNFKDEELYIGNKKTSLVTLFRFLLDEFLLFPLPPLSFFPPLLTRYPSPPPPSNRPPH